MLELLTDRSLYLSLPDINVRLHKKLKFFKKILKLPQTLPIPFVRGNFNQAKHEADYFLQLGNND
ncbi:hypothetical protein [Idiomarina abyssalis]|uniref:hypothetical protein n=1 Tax=Idiomarina abyssalis TaxID=86102 RepID=UPI003A8DA8BC|tara:strand:- start:4449 stop:4643 length:195 start_codon:yes stop_codon:yes gene_type:complete